MFGSNIRPTKTAGTRRIDHRIRAMRKLTDKFGLYTHHLQNVIADTSKQLDQATLQGKFNKLIESKVIPRAAFLLDVLKEAFLVDVLTEAFLLDVLTFVYELSGCGSCPVAVIKIFSLYTQKSIKI